MIDERLLMAILNRLRANRDDQDSWRQLKELLWRHLDRSIAHRAGIAVLAVDYEDIAVDVFMCIVEAWPWEKAPYGVKFLGFVKQLLNCRIVDHVRSALIQRGHTALERWQTIDELADVMMAGASESDDQQLVEQELEELQALLAQDDLDRKILSAQVECRNQDEVAARLGVDASTIWRRLERMKSALLALGTAARGEVQT